MTNFTVTEICSQLNNIAFYVVVDFIVYSLKNSNEVTLTAKVKIPSFVKQWIN